MKNRSVHCITTILLVILYGALATSSLAQSTLYSQAPDSLSSAGYWASTTFNFAQGYATYDDFVLPSTSSITQFSWRGAFLDVVNLNNNPVLPNTISWHIFIDRSVTVNGTPLPTAVGRYEITMSAASVSTTFVGTTTYFGHTINVYDFTANLPTAFTASAGTRYWFSPVAVLSNTTTEFAWLTGGDGGSGFNSSHQYAWVNNESSDSYVGQRNNLAFSVRGTLAANVQNVRLGIPKFVTDNGRRYFSQRVYIKGTGNGPISGLWLNNGAVYAYVPSRQIDLNNKGWVELAELQTTLIGNHSLQFIVDAPNFIYSSIEDTSFTGFDPSVNGWWFKNDANVYTVQLPPSVTNDILQLLSIPSFSDEYQKYTGLCAGMSNTARDYYLSASDKSNTLPPRNTSMRAINSTLQISFYASNNWFGAKDYIRLVRGLALPLYVPAYIAVLDSEAYRIQARLQNQDPCVISLKPPLGPMPGHAVVGTAGFFCDNIYDAERGEEVSRMHLFSVYDCNDPGHDRYVGSFQKGDPSNQPQFRFIPQDQLSSSYSSFIMWGEYTYPGDKR